MIELNKAYLSDNLEFMKKIQDDYVDLIYCDILFNTGKKFKDYDDKLGTPQQAMEWYKPRLIEMYRTLKNTGSIYLQCDYRIVHYLKVEMDKIFGYENFKNEIIWCYNGGGVTKKQWNKKHDNILFYSKTKDYTFNTQYQPYNDNSAKRLLNKHKGKNKSDRLDIGTPMVDWWTDIKCIVNPANTEYVDYNTQKPLQLMNRIIKASSNENDLVVDFFMGSGSFLTEAKALKRNYIGCDISLKAIEITNLRLTS